MSEKTISFSDLAKKGDGVLVKRGNVWTYPNAETDRSGTNIQLPVEYVSDKEVQQALRDGGLSAVTTAGDGSVLAARIKGDDDAPAISVVQAGTPEAGTDLPPNSRPSHDAGMKPMSAEDAEKLAKAQVQARTNPAEGSEKKSDHSNDGRKAR